MEMPISGYLFGSGARGESDHTHNLYFRTWNGPTIHVHQISGVTSSVLNHHHHYAGTTEPAPSGMQHTHRYFMFTTISDGHIHEIRGITGPAIPLQNGGHYHEFQGVTNVAGLTPHSHRYSGLTSG